MKEPLRHWITGYGFTSDQVNLITMCLYLVVILLAGWLSRMFIHHLLLRLTTQSLRHTKFEVTKLKEQHVFWRLADFAPVILIWAFAPGALAEFPDVAAFVRQAAEIYMLFAGLLVAFSLLSALNSIYRGLPAASRVPITTYVQSIKLFFTILVGLLAISVLLHKSPWTFMTGIGAVSAVVMLVFKDVILGFVAGISLAANDLVRPGDWIEMDKYGANGTVMDVTLTTVKVQNWDMTITMVPAYSLVSDYFINWRGMSDAGARRIKRAVYIDVTSIRYCTEEMLERFSRIDRIKSYVETKQREPDESQPDSGGDDAVGVNDCRLTNIGVFREYLAAYLHDHPFIQNSLTLMVRELAPSEYGLPLEIYAFANDTEWVHYEAIQAEIIDHVYAALGDFDLRPFQNPAGFDIDRITSHVASDP